MPTATAVKIVVNAWTSELEIKDHEDPAKPGHFLGLGGNSCSGCDMWVPWCNNTTDFLGAHYITVKPSGQAVKYWIYQCYETVYYTTVERFLPPSDRGVTAIAKQGGDVLLFITTWGVPTMCHIGL